MIDFLQIMTKRLDIVLVQFCAAARMNLGIEVGVVQAINKLSISDERKSVSSVTAHSRGR